MSWEAVRSEDKSWIGFLLGPLTADCHGLKADQIMNALIKTLLLAPLLTLVIRTEAFAIDVYIVAGQSNGWRISHLRQKSGGAGGQKVHYFGMKCVSEPIRPDVEPVLTALDHSTMGAGLAEGLLDLSNNDVVFVQYCRCGAGLWNRAANGWWPGGDPPAGKVHNDGLYGSFLKYVTHCRQVIEQQRGLDWELKGLCWHQGESDSNRPVADYGRDLEHLFWRFRHDLGEALPIVVGHIRELNDGDRAVNMLFDRLASADPLLAAVPTRDLPFAPDRDGIPDVHISREGCHELGRRMALALAEIQEDPAVGAAIQFQDVTEQAGLVKPLAGLLGHGGAWGDVDGDGDLDLYVGGFADRPDEEYLPAEGPVTSRMLINDWWRFRPAAAETEMTARTSGALFADFDNDGALDLYVANNAKPNRPRRSVGEIQGQAKQTRSALFRNEGNSGRWTIQNGGAVPDSLFTARNVGAFDYDLDGKLDLFVVEDRFRKGPRSVLLHNEGGEGELVFRDATAEVGLPENLFGLGHAVADLNDDGRPDFFVGHSNRMFLSRGDGTYFEPESLKQTFAWEPLHGEDWPCGAALGDLNGDGLFDLVVSIHCETARNRLYLNWGLKEGVPQFEDVTARAGWPESVPARCPHVEIQDFDNDGRPDVYLSAGWLDDDGTFTPLILRNVGNNSEGIPQFTPPREVAPPMVYYPAGPSADWNGDGRVDLFLINWFAGNRSRLLENRSASGNWLDVVVEGTTFNRQGIGSRITVTSGDGKRTRRHGVQELHIGSGYASGQPAVCHFGLGEVDLVDIEVRLPNGKVVRQDGVPVNRRVTIHE